MRKETIVINNQHYLLKIHFEERDNPGVSFSPKNINIRIPLNLSNIFFQPLPNYKEQEQWLKENGEKLRF